jgi:hypothetical protein
VAPAGGPAPRRPASGFEGVPTTVLSRELDEARKELKAAQSRADMIRRELKRRKKHTTR